MKLNRHQIAGKVVEAETGSLPNSGLATLKLRVMTDDGWYDTKKKEYVKRNTYHTVKAIGKVAADNAGIQKDDWVFVEGQRLTDSWENRDGKKQYADYLRPTIVTEIPDPWEGKGSKASQTDDDIPF